MNKLDLVPEEHVIVLFGATGDLARRKLLPGLFRLAQAELLPERYRIVAVSRDELTDDEFRRFAWDAIEQFGHRTIDELSWTTFWRRFSYVVSGDDAALADAVARAERELGGEPRRLHYLSVPPFAFADVIETLRATGLNERARVVIEKPFGNDVESARALNGMLHSVFDESDIFRIDHFLGKETVQNILALRFANGVFEPIWNRDHIEHVQIDVPETLGLEGRANFYERTGAFRDMLVTHLLQVLGFVAMEPPTSFEAKALVDETVKVFASMSPLRPEDVVRGQYAGYRNEPGVALDSDTETYVAAKVFVDNWRWAGVPFYLRTGKRMAERRRVVTITFRDPPRNMFSDVASHGPNELVFELGEPGGISASFLVKAPGAAMHLSPAQFNFRYDESFATANQLEAYEKLIHDAMLGDRMLFTRADGIERLWEVSAPALDSPSPLHPYAQGSWGPSAADELLAPARWHLPGGAALRRAA